MPHVILVLMSAVKMGWGFLVVQTYLMACRKIGPLFAVQPRVIFLQGASPEVIALQNRRSFASLEVKISLKYNSKVMKCCKK